MPPIGFDSRTVVVSLRGPPTRCALTADAEPRWCHRSGFRCRPLTTREGAGTGLTAPLAVLQRRRELHDVLSQGPVGPSGRDALPAMAILRTSRTPPGPGRPPGVLAPPPITSEHMNVTDAIVAMAGRALWATTAARAGRHVRPRSHPPLHLHGFVTLESSGCFGLPQSVTDVHPLVDPLAPPTVLDTG